jgi:DNA-binding MarR family transcriptional regulator
METKGVLDSSLEVIFSMLIDQHRKHSAELELTLPQVQMLMLLRGQVLLASGLAAVLGISAPAVSQLTDRLSSRGLIQRRQGETDRRSVCIGLTDQGRRVVDGMRKRRCEMFEALIAGLSSTDKEAVVRALGLLEGLLVPRRAETGSQPARSEAEPPDGTRTAKPYLDASNDRGGTHKGVAGATRKRMRIEWD